MPKKHDLLRLISLTLVILWIAACSPAPTPVAEPTDPPATNTPEPEPTSETDTDAQAATDSDTVAQEPTIEPTVAPTQAPTVSVVSDGSNGLILAWVAPASAPGRQGGDVFSELVYFALDGTRQSLMTLPAGTTRVAACGDASTSPDGSVFAFMTTTGGAAERANLHLIRGVSTEIETVAEDLNPIACVGSSPFHFSPDGSRFGFIDWSANANNADSPIGRLLIYDTEGVEQATNIENVTDFKLTDSGAVFASFFLDSDDLATEVGIFTWDGSNDREISTLRAEEGCTYTSASVVPVSEERLAAILGYRCSGSSTQWQLYTIDAGNNTAQLESSEATGGRYFGFSDTNATWLSPDGETLWFTVPDGVSNQTVSLLNTPVDSVSTTMVIDRFAIMPTVSDLPYDANNATARFSPNGQYLAIVRNEGGNNAILHVVNLNEPTLAPVQVDAGDSGDTIATLAFSQDNSKLILVAGTDEGGNNALVSVDLTTGNESRIARGRYAQIVIAPDASQVAAMSWVVYDEDEDPYLSLVVVDAESSEETVIFEGGTVDGEGNLTDQAFAYPLSWRTP